MAVEFRDVVKVYHRLHRNPVGIKHALLHLPSFLREVRSANEFRALDGVSFQVKKGETFGICGRNGAGKSTMLGLMAGVIRPTRGEVIVRGRIAPLLELGAGFHPELTGRENVFLNATILGMARSEIVRRFDAIVEFSGLRDFIDEPMRTYSSGMYMRLGFSVAVHTDPEVLLVDEVLAVGDAEFQQKCLAKMEEFRAGGITIVFVSHDYAQVKKLCHRVAVLSRGKASAVGPPGEVEAEFLGSLKSGVDSRDVQVR
ncbi:MAG: ABC transporter ATP-binding protein [Planctomycetes bacterium]|nr:ABC transporter ATP-binding protein [Planctomycetota bacterium]